MTKVKVEETWLDVAPLRERSGMARFVNTAA